jgi:hypothetical protein
LRSGCLNLVVRVGVVSVAAILAALSMVVILSFAVSALGQPGGVEKIVMVLVASAAGFAFFLVGRGIWRDLRRRSTARPEEEPTKERGR